uniref:Uncharacterized protein n=1 Tax=Globisporangium ultimum (strain ATCC 200006 / CBS 805.95 / DAOM BR144) TaxID=431595 RepID=K3X963_GLOUD
MDAADGGRGAKSGATPLPRLQLEYSRDAQQEELPTLEPQVSTPSSENGAFALTLPATPYLASPSTMLAAKRKQQSEPLDYGFQQDGGSDDIRRDTHEHFQKVIDGETSTQSGLSNSSAASTASFQQQQQAHAPHLQNHNIASQSINSEDDSTDFAHVAYGELAQPRPEIVLRWKRFGVLVIIAFGAIAGATALLVKSFEITDEQSADAAERKVESINTYSGIVMGFFESFLGLLLGNLLPVYLVYLHNLKWFPGDDPATKSSKFKKVALMLFIPLVMVALGNSFSAVQANQRINNTDRRRMQALHLHKQPSAQPGRRLLMFEQQQSANDTNTVVLPLEETILRSAVTRRVVAVPPHSTPSCSKVDTEAGNKRGLLNALPSATFGFPMKSWQREMYPDPVSWSSTKKIQLQDSVEVGDVMAYTTAIELLDLGLSQFKRSLVGMKDVEMESRRYGGHATSTSGLLSEILSEFQKLNLTPSFANPVRLIQLIERKPAVEAIANGHQVTNAIGSPQNNCSSAVDTYVQFVTKNHLSLDEHLVQPMYTAALFYLFQRGAVVDAAETAEIAVSRRLQDGTTSDSVKVYLSNTNIGQISTWVGCGVILILSILVIVLPNERARLEPPKGGNARAERFIAVQTEESYPNLVYKKRFLIGKTGEEIKFGEFAVESVKLHHKMEEDEEIYL